ncbi:hypothetical protein HZA56_13730 [Candidatus Poribacteria bacterium]|nr:hypothetical protein [Candidatus Poribacteria bacterium]
MRFRRVTSVLLGLALITLATNVWAELPAPTWGAGFPRLLGDKVLLMWSAVPGAESYKVYRNGQVLASSAATNSIDPKPAAGDNRYTVVAIAGGAEGAKSEEKLIQIKTVEEIIVAPPTGVISRPIEDGLAIVWDRPKGTVLAFNVYRSLESGKGYEMIGSVQDTTYIDQNVKEGKKYYYTIAALDGAFKETEKSKEISAVYTKMQEETVAAGPAAKEYKIVIKATKLANTLDLLGSEKLLGAVDTAISDAGKVYVVDQVAGNIKVFDLEGNYLSQFGRKGPEENDFRLAYGVGISPDGKVYVADCNKVFVYSPDGSQISSFGLEPPKVKEILEAASKSKEGQSGALKPYPVDVAFDSKGNMLVVDNAFARVVVLDRNHKYVTEFGKYGHGDGELKHPSYIAVNSRGEIGIVDGMNRRVQVFTADYKFKYGIGAAKSFVGSFLGLGGITVTKEGNFVVADPPLESVQVFDRETGAYLYHFGNEKAEVEPDSKQRALWDVSNPAGVSIDLKNNNLWICMPKASSAVIRHIAD